jgi:hypothetical protein
LSFNTRSFLTPSCERFGFIENYFNKSTNMKFCQIQGCETVRFITDNCRSQYEFIILDFILHMGSRILNRFHNLCLVGACLLDDVMRIR